MKYLQERRGHLLQIIILGSAAFFLWYFYFQLVTPGYLSFSDSAKFADIARNVVNGFGYKANFSFFSPALLKRPPDALFAARGIPVAMPLSIAAFFSLLGISDSSVVSTSGFYYVLLVLTTFALGKKLFGNLVGFLAAVAVAANLNFLDYATSGASETLFALEIMLAAYLILLRKRWATIGSFLVLVLLYFTRPQGFIFIGGFIFLWLLLRFKLKNALLMLVLFALFIFGLDKLVLYPLSFRSPVYPIVTRGLQAIFQYSANTAVSDALRGGVGQQLGIVAIVKKVFYNLYNFYKLLPQIASPYLWALFVMGLFKWGKDRVENSLKVATIFMVLATFLVTALTIPFFRYLHPVVPLVYLFAVAMLVWIVGEISKSKFLNSKQIQISKFKLSKELFVILTSSFLVLFFVVGQTLGVIFLDSRFKAARTNRGKPPVYVQLSWILRDNTDFDDVIITNLDTWGSWYGERKTVWFPLKPSQLDLGDDRVHFDAIYLTSYLTDDENYYMGDEWRDVFYNPESPEDKYIAENFELKDIYKIASGETYEKQEARAVLLVRKEE